MDEPIRMKLNISVVTAAPQLIKAADEILKANIRCTKELRKEIRALVKAYIDERDEVEQAIKDIQTGRRAQLDTRSPKEMLERALRLLDVALANPDHQDKVRKIAESYLLLAEKNDATFEDFKQQVREKLPPKG